MFFCWIFVFRSYVTQICSVVYEGFILNWYVLTEETNTLILYSSSPLTLQIPSADTHTESVCNNFGATQKQTGLHRPKLTTVWTWCQRGGMLPNAYTVQKNLKHIFLEMKPRALLHNFYIHVSVRDLYIPTMGPWQTNCGNIKIAHRYINVKTETEHYSSVLEITRPHSLISRNT